MGNNNDIQHSKRAADLRQRLQTEALEEFKEGTLIRKWKEIADSASDPMPLWGNLLYLNAVTIIIGEPGIGKTTLEYALLKEISHTQPFLGVHPTCEVKAMICDFESADCLIKQRYLKMTDGEKEYPNIRILNTTNYDFFALIPSLGQQRETFPFNLLIIDNMLTAFDSMDENDNAEARNKIKMCQGLAREWNCSIIVCHHPSKANLGGTRKGSGAFAWARCCDIYLNFNSVNGNNDMIEIEPAKNRYSEDKTPIYCEKAGNGEFIQADPPLGTTFPGQKPIDRLCRMISDFSSPHTRQQIISMAKKDIGVESATVDRAIKRLLSEGIIIGDGYKGYLSQKVMQRLEKMAEKLPTEELQPDEEEV